MPRRHQLRSAMIAGAGAFVLACAASAALAQTPAPAPAPGRERLCIADEGKLKCRAADGSWEVSQPDADNEETVDTQVAAGGDPETIAACNDKTNAAPKIEACTRIIRGGGGGAKSHAAAYFKRAKANEAGGEVEKAISDYTEALRFNPELRQALNNRGDLHFQRKDYQAALADFNLALGIDGNYMHALRNRAKVHHATGDDAAALVELSKVLAERPRDRKARIARIEVYIAAGDLALALEDIDVLLAKRPRTAKAYVLRDEVRAYVLRSDVLGRQGDWQGANAAADQALKSDKENIEALRAKANASWQLKRYPDVIKAANDGLRIVPNDAELLSLKARASRVSKRSEAPGGGIRTQVRAPAAAGTPKRVAAPAGRATRPAG